MRKAAAAAAGLVVAALFGLAGCGQDAAPASTEAPSGEAPSGAPSDAPTNAARAVGGTVVGPDGYDALKLGMSRSDVEATGLVVAFDDRQGDAVCPAAATVRTADPLNPASALVSAKLGVVRIHLADGLHTPTGVGPGSSLADIKKAYPPLKLDPGTGGPDEDGRYFAPVPGNAQAVYRIVIINNKAAQFALELTNQDCPE
jgi:hypothetical protein